MDDELVFFRFRLVDWPCQNTAASEKPEKFAFDIFHLLRHAPCLCLHATPDLIFSSHYSYSSKGFNLQTRHFCAPKKKKSPAAPIIIPLLNVSRCQWCWPPAEWHIKFHTLGKEHSNMTEHVTFGGRAGFRCSVLGRNHCSRFFFFLSAEGRAKGGSTDQSEHKSRFL